MDGTRDIPVADGPNIMVKVMHNMVSSLAALRDVQDPFGLVLVRAVDLWYVAGNGPARHRASILEAAMPPELCKCRLTFLGAAGAWHEWVGVGMEAFRMLSLHMVACRKAGKGC